MTPYNRPFPGYGMPSFNPPDMISGGPSVQPVPTPPVSPPPTKGTPTGPQYGPQVGPVDPAFNVNPSVGPVPPTPMLPGPSSGSPVALPPGLVDTGAPMIAGSPGPSPRERLAAALIGKQQEVQHPMQAVGNAASMMAQAYSDRRQKEAGTMRNKMPIPTRGPTKFSPPTKPAAYAPPRPSNPWPKG